MVKPDPSGLNGGYKPSKVGTTGVVFEAIDGGFKDSVQIHVTDKELGGLGCDFRVFSKSSGYW